MPSQAVFCYPVAEITRIKPTLFDDEQNNLAIGSIISMLGAMINPSLGMKASMTHDPMLFYRDIVHRFLLPDSFQCYISYQVDYCYDNHTNNRKRS